MKKRKQIHLYADWCDIISQYDDRVRLEIYDAVMLYAQTGEVERGLSQVAQVAFSFIRNDIDFANQEQRDKDEQRSEAGRTAAAARWGHKSKKKESDKQRPKTQKAAKFIPPSQDEIRQYISEKHYNVDAERFYLFYESKGWMVGKNKMKNWRAAVANWNKTNKADGTKENNGGTLADPEQSGKSSYQTTL